MNVYRCPVGLIPLRLPAFGALALQLVAGIATAAGWTLLHSGPEVPALYDVAFPDANNGWAVGAAGSILSTADGGATWSNRTFGAYDFYAVHFRGITNGWAAGHLIYATTNGGLTWTQRSNPSGQTLQDVFFVSKGCGYAVGMAGTILSTTNAGAVWTPQSSGTNANLYAVDFISLTRGWIAGYGTLLQTTDGATWSPMSTGISEGIYGLDFLDSTNGWAVGQNQKIWRTADGGETWTCQYQGSIGYHLLDITMLSLSNGWACGRNGVILRTEDGGGTWAEVYNPAVPRHMHALDFPGAATGWAVGELQSQQGAVAAYFPPATVQGIVRLEGRASHGGTRIAAGRADGVTNETVTGTSGGFEVEPPLGNVDATASRAGYLPAVKSGMEVRAAQMWHLPPALLPGGDATGDGRIDVYDVTAVMTNLYSGSFDPDLNGDGAVNVLDAVLAARNQGRQGPIDWPTRGIVQWIQNSAIQTTPSYGPFDSAGRFAPDLVEFPGGLYRMYYTGTDGTNCRVLSMTTTNGTDWLLESGARIEPTNGYADVYSPDLCRLTNGLWRMYFSARTTGPVADVLSAVSSNGLDWAIEPGVRIAHGGLYDRLLAQSSSMLRYADASPRVFPDGTLRIIYTGHDGTNVCLLAAHSSDGVVWVKDGLAQEGASALALTPSQEPLANLGLSSDLTQIVDPFIQMEEDGSFTLLFSRFFDLVTAGATNTYAKGLFRFWSKDGTNWNANVSDDYSETWPTLSGDTFGGQGLAPWAGMIGGNLMMLAGGLDSTGLRQLFMSHGLDEEAPPLFRSIETRRVSISQHEVTVEYDLQSVPFPLFTGATWFIGTQAIVDGMRAANMVSRFMPATNMSGTVVIPLDYIGTKPLLTTHIEVMLWRKIGEFLDPVPVLVCWKALQVADMHSAGFDEMQNTGWGSGFLFGAQANLLGGALDFGGELTLSSLRAAALDAEDPGAGSVVSSSRVRERILWLPPSSGKIEAAAYGEAEYSGTPEVPGGPYLWILADYTYRNQWGNSGQIDAKVYDGQTNRLDAFTVEAPAVDPTHLLPPTVPGGNDGGREQSYIRLRYTGTNTLQDTLIQIRITAGSTVVAEHWLRQTDAPASAYCKTWRPLARFDFGIATVKNTGPDLAEVSFLYDVQPLRHAPELPMVSLDVLDENGHPLDDDDVRCTAYFVPQANSRLGTITARYLGRDERGPHSETLRLRAQIGGVTLAEKSVPFDMDWAQSDVGNISIVSYPVGIDEAVVNGADLSVDVKTRAWTASGSNAVVWVDVIAQREVQRPPGLQSLLGDKTERYVVSNIVCTPATPRNAATRALALEATNDTISTVTLRYEGTNTFLHTVGLLAHLVDPTDGRDIRRDVYRYPKYWTPASTGAIESVTLTATNSWEAALTINYSFWSVLNESVILTAEWFDSVLHGGGSTFYYLNEPRDFFAGTRQLGEEGVQLTQVLNIRHMSREEHLTDLLKVTLQAGGRGSSHDIATFWLTDTNRLWTVPPHYELAFDRVSQVNPTRVEVDVSYRIKSSQPGHVYQLQVYALKGAESNLVTDVTGLYTIPDPDAAAESTQTAEITVNYTGTTYCVRTHLLGLMLTDNGAPATFGDGSPVRSEVRQVLDWNTDVPGTISTPVLIPISANEAALQAEFEIKADTPDLVSYVKIHSRENGYVYECPDATNLFIVQHTPALVHVPPGGTNGVLLGRITFAGVTNWWKTDSDFISVGLRTLATGDILLESTLFEPYAWSVWDDVAAEHSPAFPYFWLGEPVFSRPGPDRLDVKIDYRVDRYYVSHSEEGPILKGYLWSGLQPLFRMPESVTMAMEDSGDEAGYEDIREVLFESPEYYIGQQEIESTPSGQVGPGGLMDNNAPPITAITKNEGTNCLAFRFQPPVGERDVDMLTVAFFRRDGTPLFSKTMPIPADMRHVHAVDQIAPFVNGRQLFSMNDSTIASLSEMTAMVSGFNNSRLDGTAMWIKKFPTATSYNPYWPLELMDMRRIFKGYTNTSARMAVAPDGYTPAGEPYLSATGWVNSVSYRFRLAAEGSTRGYLSAPFTFVQGLTDGTVITQYSQTLSAWEQPAALNVSSVYVSPGEYCNQQLVSGVVVNIDGEIPESCKLAAVALSNGVPVKEVVCEPQRIGTNRCVNSFGLRLEFDYLDSGLTSVSADQLRLLIRSPSTGILCQRLVTLPSPVHWHRPQMHLEITDVRDCSYGIDVSYRWISDNPSPPEVGPLVDTVDYINWDFLGIKVEALLFGKPPPTGPIEGDQIYSIAQGECWPYARTSEVHTVTLFFQDEEAVHTFTSEIKADLAVYRQTPGSGPERLRAVAGTTVDHAKRWVNDRTYIVGTMKELIVVNDGDGDIRKSGENLCACIGLSLDDATRDLIANGQMSSAAKTTFNFPVDYNPQSRWLETDAVDSWKIDLPVYCSKEYSMADSMAMGVMLLDDDAIPSSVYTFLDVIFKAAEIVATAFGQSWVSKPLELVNSFIDGMIKAGSVTDQIGTGGTILSRKDGWGTLFSNDFQWAECSYQTGGGLDLVPSFRTRRVTIPPEPKHIRVKLQKIEIHEDGDYGEAEIYGKWRVWDGGLVVKEGRIPDEGYLEVDDPYTWDHSERPPLFDVMDAGPFIFVEVAVWDKDDPDYSNDHDILGDCCWTEWIHEPGWASTNLVGNSSREGDIKVYIRVEEVP